MLYKVIAFAKINGGVMEDIDKWETQFRKGIVEALVLKAVAYQKKSYGYQLLVFLNEQGLEISEGTLYPLINRMEKNEWLVSEWEMPSGGGHPKRVYQVNPKSQGNLGIILNRMEHYFQVFNKMKGL